MSQVPNSSHWWLEGPTRAVHSSESGLSASRGSLSSQSWCNPLGLSWWSSTVGSVIIGNGHGLPRVVCLWLSSYLISRGKQKVTIGKTTIGHVI